MTMQKQLGEWLWTWGLLTWIAVAGAGVAYGQTDDDDDTPPAGLLVKFEHPDSEPIVRVDARVAAHGRWSTIDRRLPDEADVTATWTGRLKVQVPGAYRLLVHGKGTVRVAVRDKQVLEAQFDEIGWRASPPLEWNVGAEPIEVRYTGTEAGAQLGLFWAPPGLGVEPLGARHFEHSPSPEVDRDPFARGETLVRSLRCAGCHTIKGETLLSAPSLDRLSGQLHHAWLVSRLTEAGHESAAGTAQRMPHFKLDADDARAVAAYLLASKNAPPPFKPDDQQPFPAPKLAPPAPASTVKTKAKPRQTPDAKAGERLAWTIGCVACHTLADGHAAQPFDGGDLRAIARKRPAGFFSRWLADPSSLNVDRRMPEFELTPLEREDLAKYLETLHGGDARGAVPPQDAPAADDHDLVERGREVFLQRQCVACHRGPGLSAPRPSGRAGLLNAESRWDASCLGEPDPQKQRPGYRLAAPDQAAIRRFATAVADAPAPRGRRQIATDTLVRERGCLACHARDELPGLAARLPEVARRYDDLAPLVPALTPPALTSVGDKLHDPALAGAITRLSGVHRPYLMVRMPRFRMSAAELDMIIYGLTAADRIPDDVPALVETTPRGTADTNSLNENLVRSAGGRLVTPDGFGCTSCHTVGKVEPPPGPLAARGPSLTKLESRIRRSWFDRFVRNPVRIVPRMEMPSVQLAVRGVLDERLDRQLDAVWQVLNLPDFEPPEPNPVQTLRRSGLVDQREPAALVTDLVLAEGHTFIKPALIGLGNRHNVLFDFETNRLARWSIGDVGRQRAKGKGWHWEAAGTDLLKTPRNDSEFVLVGSQVLQPIREGQFTTEFDGWRHLDDLGLELAYRVRFQAAADQPPVTLRVRQAWSAKFASGKDGLSGFERRWTIEGAPAGMEVRWRASNAEQIEQGRRDDEQRTFAPPGSDSRWTLQTAGTRFDDDGSVLVPAKADDPTRRELAVTYLTKQVVDHFVPIPAPKVVPLAATPLDVAPGFAASRLPLSAEQMPTALAWRPDGQLLIASLKGRVWLARDTNGDGDEDTLAPISDELAAPYGLAVGERYVDVTTKYGVVRLHDENQDGVAERSEIVASGWGHTADYHDWTTGLPSDADGNFYIGLACQQDKRSAAAAKWRGTVVKLIPRTPTPDEPRRFELQLVSGGHRFPMGVALNPAGAVFVTDNQGNYNPFNELNHARPGVRFGFINAIEQKPDFKPPVEEPAINLPHPWTRSVNGLAFLATPAALRAKLRRDAFGPFEGHLIGCEYDTRRLIRMSLRRVGDTYQGTAYPFSVSMEDPARDFLGPLCAAVSPNGDLYVGGIRDSGWGAGNNIGEVVRLRPTLDKLPAGIAEAWVERGRLVVSFTSAVDRTKAADPSNYAIESYRRVATPAYGGPDMDRRAEAVQRVEVSDDARRVTLELQPLREGFVYELRVKSLIAAGTFFPAEAYLTVRSASAQP